MMAHINSGPHRHLRIMHWNLNGISFQLHTFKHFIHDQQIVIAWLNETHLKQHHKWKIRNYSIIRNDRPGLKDGTAIVIITHLYYEEITIQVLQTIEATLQQAIKSPPKIPAFPSLQFIKKP